MLTVEELNKMQIGDWMWIVGKNYSFYRRKSANNERYFCVYLGDYLVDKVYYDDYGKTWTAYRNKEEAEGKSIALPYLLCTSSKFACVIWRDFCGKVQKTYTMPIDEAKAFLRKKEQDE